MQQILVYADSLTWGIVPDANTVISASKVDGVHLDRDQHLTLGAAAAGVVRLILAAGE